MIIIVALDINPKDSGFEAFVKQTPKARIDQAVATIQAVVKDLLPQYPKSLIIFSWREYGLAGPYNSFTPEDEAYFNNEMLKLINKNVVIIGGAQAVDEALEKILIKEKVKSTEETKSEMDAAILAEQRFAKINENFEKLKYIVSEEERRGFRSNLTSEQKKFEALKKLHTESKEKPAVEARSNTCKIFCIDQNTGNFKIIKHRKLIPSSVETKDKPLTFFRPATLKTQTGNFVLRGPGVEFTCDVNICMDTHYLQITKADMGKPFLQFVLSSSIAIFPANFKSINSYGTYIIHLDSIYRPRLIVTDETFLNPKKVQLYQENIIDAETFLNSQAVQLYQVNLLDNQHRVIGPLMPYIPIEFTLHKKISSAEKAYQDLIEKLNAFLNLYLEEKTVEACEVFLKKSLEELKPESSLEEFFKRKVEKSWDIKDYHNFISLWVMQLKEELTALRLISEGFYSFKEAELAAVKLYVTLTPMQESKQYRGQYLDNVIAEVLKLISEHITASEQQQSLNATQHAPVIGKSMSQDSTKDVGQSQAAGFRESEAEFKPSSMFR